MIPKDKLLHFVAGLSVAWAVGIGCLAIGLPTWISILAAGVAGGIKEAWDSSGHGNPELWDFVCTLAGGAAALIVLFAVRGVL